MGYPKDYLIGVRLFQRGDWFESHEAWERVWNETAGRERFFYQGLIQLAVALCHFHNGNTRGAARLHVSASNYLREFRPRHAGLDLEQLLVQMDKCFAPAHDADPEEWRTMPVGTAPDLKLDPPPETWPEIPPEFEGMEEA